MIKNGDWRKKKFALQQRELTYKICQAMCSKQEERSHLDAKPDGKLQCPGYVEKALGELEAWTRVVSEKGRERSRDKTPVRKVNIMQRMPFINSHFCKEQGCNSSCICCIKRSSEWGKGGQLSASYPTPRVCPSEGSPSLHTPSNGLHIILILDTAFT